MQGSIDCIKDHVDHIILVYQERSNFGEGHSPLPLMPAPKGKIIHINYIPKIELGGTANEKLKRNNGINYARILGCTHFLLMDCDEYYEDFKKAKQEYQSLATDGSVCKMFTYFKLPTLRFQMEDNYYVPFIHKLDLGTSAGTGQYSFYVDPTRKINCKNVTELTQVRMHHFSWVRKDIGRKARNSSAKANIEKSDLLKDYNKNLQAGDYISDFRQCLIEVPNQFNINL